MGKKENYKSPVAALLWSLALPGFGQLYNKDYFLGIVLMVWEIVLNLQSHLNVAILYTLRGDFHLADRPIDFEWGLFYPSIFCYSLWQAYNQAHAINRRIQQKENSQQVYLTGFFFGMVTGMNFGIAWHGGFLATYSPIFKTPVYSGITLGLIGAVIGHLLELLCKRLRSYSRTKG
ncbi:hypothetical protein [Lentibacillus daqui]|uniref:hypothetical protein n=1 Tax=Lentibacillus daqui TaxID=2911514 RepID=UPI0022B1ED6B|nr:hypothetical protein [Lentibacillus daqui]